MRSFFGLGNLNWRRLYCRVVSQEGTPESIARGVSLGLFVGFGVPIGGHILIAVPLAFLLKANKFLAVLFTFPVNPYTIPVLYPIQCYLGGFVLGSPMKFSVIEAEFEAALLHPSGASLRRLGADMLWPFLAGGLIIALLSAALGYYASLGMAQKYRDRKEARLRRRLAASSMRGKAGGDGFDGRSSTR